MSLFFIVNLTNFAEIIHRLSLIKTRHLGNWNKSPSSGTRTGDRKYLCRLTLQARFYLITDSDSTSLRNVVF